MSVVRPRPGDLERAARLHEAVPSGEFHGLAEACDLCGFSIANKGIHR